MEGAVEDRIYEINKITRVKDLEKFITKHENHLTRYEWFLISDNKALNVNLIEKYSETIDWEWISIFRKLPVRFMETNLGYVNIYCISRYQNLTYNFIKKYKDTLSMDQVIKNNNVMKLPEFLEIRSWYEKMKNKKKYQKVWEENKNNMTVFKSRKLRQQNIKKSDEEIDELLSKMAKNQLKSILKKAGIKFYYHDTVPVLKDKIKENDLV